MAFVLADRVKESCSSPGTGTATLLGASTGYQSFSAGIGANNTTYYVIADQSGANWEVGLGTIGAGGTTLARTTVLSSSNSGSLVNFASGTQDVFCDYPAGKQISSDYPNALGVVTPAAGTFTTITGQTEVLRNTQNLITYSEDLSNAIWNGAGTTATIVSTAFATNTSQLAQTGSGYWTNNATGVTGAINGKTYVASAWVWTTTDVGKTVGLRIAGTSGGSSATYIITLTSTPTRYNIAVTFTTSDAYPQFGLDSRTLVGADGLAKTYLVWGAQIEEAPSVGTYVKTTSAAVYNAPTLSFNGVSTISLDQSGNLSLQPAGTGALQAQATTSSTVGGNARGANAVDWQTSRNAASNVASGLGAVIAGGVGNIGSGTYSNVSGGTGNVGSGYISGIGGGYINTAGGFYVFVGGGQANAANGYYNFIGAGFTNSGTASAAVTTQSATMNGTTAVTLAATNANIKVGQYITGTSIAGDTYVAAISGTALTLSKVASGSSTSTLSFYTPHGVVVGGGNNQATGSYSFIGGGGDAGTAANRNTASGDWSFVGGGAKNTASGIGSVVCGGGADGSGTTYANTSSNKGSFVGGGFSNTASGQGAVTVGGYNNFNNSLYATIGGGQSNNANGAYSSIIGGYYGTTRSIIGNTVFTSAAPLGAGAGLSQSSLLVLAKQTTDATATVITSDGGVAGSTNQVILPNNSAYYFKVSVISGVTGGGNSKAWTIEGLIKRGSGVGTTAIVGTPVVNIIAADAGASTWTVTATADTTNGGLAITFTGQASTTIRTVCSISTTEMTY